MVQKNYVSNRGINRTILYIYIAIVSLPIIVIFFSVGGAMACAILISPFFLMLLLLLGYKLIITDSMIIIKRPCQRNIKVPIENIFNIDVELKHKHIYSARGSSNVETYIVIFYDIDYKELARFKYNGLDHDEELERIKGELILRGNKFIKTNKEKRKKKK